MDLKTVRRDTHQKIAVTVLLATPRMEMENASEVSSHSMYVRIGIK